MRLRELRGSAFDFLFIYFIIIIIFLFKYVWDIWEDLRDSDMRFGGGGGERGIVEKRNSLGEKQFFAEEKYFGEKFFPLRYEF